MFYLNSFLRPKMVPRILFLAIATLLSVKQAAATDLTGIWQMSSKACSSLAPYEDPFFGSYVKSFSWEFKNNASVIENIKMFDPEKNFSCEAQLEYSVELLPPIAGPLGYRKRMILTRTKLTSACMRSETRPLKISFHYLDYPNFLETYESPADLLVMPCPSNDSVITQFRKL